jgi:hypothetical protein
MSVTELAKAILPRLSLNEFEYSWNVSDAALAALPVSFSRPNGPRAEINIALRLHLSQLWHSSGHEERRSLADWVINDWGGIRGNKSNTILRYVEEASSENPATPFKGVSSYSKV